MPRMQEVVRVRVLTKVCIHRANDTEPVRRLRNMRQQVTYPLTALTVLLERSNRTKRVSRIVKLGGFFRQAKRLPVLFN